MHALTLGASRFDVMKFASVEYHYGLDGVDVLNESFIQDCGHGIVKATVENVVVCFNNIIMVHRKVRELWHNNYPHTMGPQVSTILSKHIKVFLTLDSLGVEEVVAFYDCLQEVRSNYVIAIMPFDDGTPERPRKSGGRFQHGPGQLACPNCNHHPYMKDEQCAACRRIGHVAKRCDMLATAIGLKKYMKKDLSPSLCDQIEKEWLHRWKEKLENPVHTPCQVLWSYVDDLGISVTKLDAEMEWNCWDKEEDDYANEE